MIKTNICTKKEYGTYMRNLFKKIIQTNSYQKLFKRKSHFSLIS